METRFEVVIMDPPTFRANITVVVALSVPFPSEDCHSAFLAAQGRRD